MKIRFLFPVLVSFLLFSCGAIPPRDIVIFGNCPIAGPYPFFMEKGSLNEDAHGVFWLDVDEFERLMEGTQPPTEKDDGKTPDGINS